MQTNSTTENYAAPNTLAVPVTRTFTLTITLPFVCPTCQEPCGYLYDNARCLGCELDADEVAIARYEAQEADEAGAEENCCTCGAD